MIQFEVAERLTAEVGSFQYSTITVLYNLTHDLEILHKVSRHCFRPEPEVDSAIVRFKRKSCIPPREIRAKIKKIVNNAFCYRRKKLINALSLGLPDTNWDTVLEELKISPSLRPEEIEPKEWLRIAEKLKD